MEQVTQNGRKIWSGGMYKKIIVAVDMSAFGKAQHTLQRAAALSDDGGEIIVLHVVEDVPNYIIIDVPQELVTDAIRNAEEKLVGLCRTMKLTAFVDIRTGPPASCILAAADEHQADLVIVASHVPNISNYFFGATADRVVRHAKCSVLVERR
jgi:nucleotide-binding universal stress UspA family protein